MKDMTQGIDVHDSVTKLPPPIVPIGEGCLGKKSLEE
jgi:hypothetical protein